MMQPQMAYSYIQTQHGERGKVESTGCLKQKQLPHWAGHQTTNCESMLLLMTLIF